MVAGPLPEGKFSSVIHPAFVLAVQAQPGCVVKLMLPAPPTAGSVFEVGEIEYVHGAESSEAFHVRLNV